MNTGAFGEGFPYSNFHDLNMDWIIKIVKDFLDQYTNIQQTITDGVNNIQQTITDGVTNIQNTTEEGETSLNTLATTLQNLLNQWYETHSEDIANEMLSAINEFNTRADQKAIEAIASIPSDYSDFYAEVKDLEKNNAYNLFFGLLNFPSFTHNGITFTWTGNECVANGTSTASAADVLYNSALPETVIPGKPIYIDYQTTSSDLPLRVIFTDSNNTELSRRVLTAPIITRVPDNATKVNIALFVSQGKTLSNATCKLNTITSSFTNSMLTTKSLLLYDFTLNGYDSVYDIPYSYWRYRNGTQLQEIFGNDSPPSLRPTQGYILTAKRFLSNLIYFTIDSTDLTEHYTGSTTIAQPRTPWWKKWDIEDNLDKNRTEYDDDDIAVQIYTDFERLEGWWDSTGHLYTTSNPLTHSQFLEVIPGKTYYIGATWDHGVYGYFFDRYKNGIEPLRNTDITEYEYENPNADPSTQGTYNYVKLYQFTVPANARYFSYNRHSTNTEFTYRQYIASIPVFRMSDTGNLIIRKSDPAYQKFGNRKLCIIGPSYVMLDRLRRTGNFLNNGETQTQFLAGFQEYLMPYWKSVTSYGFSGASYGKLDSGTGVLHTSIYTRICTEEVLDLSDFDDYIIFGNHNLMTLTGAGSVTTWDDLGDETTYIGGVRHIMEYIYTKNPQAQIYLCNMVNVTDDYNSPARRAVMDQVNTELHKISSFTGSPVINCAASSGMNYYSVPKWTYDNNTHPNQIGMQMIGEGMLREML